MNNSPNDDDPEPDPNSGLSNLMLGFILVGLVVAWFLFGLVYSVFVILG